MTTAANRRSGTVAIPITELEQSAFCQTSGNLRTRTLEEEFKSGVRWQKVPVRYLKLSPEELDSGIAAAREALADQLVILGHHYQRDDVIKYSDFRGGLLQALQNGRGRARCQFRGVLRRPFHG